MPINISLPNGRTVDVETQHGANYFINFGGAESFEYFSQNLEHAKEIYERVEGRRNKRLTTQEKHELDVFYATAAAITGSADPETFAKIPASEIEIYVNHTVEQIEKKTRDDHWVRNGTLVDMHEKAMIYGWIDLCMHAMPCKLAFEGSFFKVLAKFAAAPRAVVPDDAESIAMIVANAVVSVVFNKAILSSPEKAFKKLESCGMLSQFIRLSVSHRLDSCSRSGVLKLYDELILCSSFIKKKFVKNEACGDITMSILANPSLRNHPVVPKLHTIRAFLDLSGVPTGVPAPLQSLKGGMKICRFCSKNEHTLEFQQSLRKCSRCKCTYYCSKECQKADWKSHKLTCQPAKNSEVKQMEFTENTVLSFVKNNYCSIMKEIVKVTDETGKTKGDLLLEIDFATPPGHSGMAPAFKSPPEFTIALAKDYFEGSRPNEPDWFYKNEDRGTYQRNVDNVFRVLKDTYGRLTDDHLLGFIRSPTGDSGCYRLAFATPIKKQMFSEEAVVASRKAIQDEDFAHLESIFGEDTVEMRTLRRQFGGLPSASELDNIRHMLNTNFGADFSLSRDK